jgi:hypothetical protein
MPTASLQNPLMKSLALWRTHRQFFLRCLQWSATAFCFTGALLLALNPSMGAGLFIFYLFLIGHLLFIADNFIEKSLPYLALNFGFLALDIAAIIVRWQIN